MVFDGQTLQSFVEGSLDKTKEIEKKINALEAWESTEIDNVLADELIQTMLSIEHGAKSMELKNIEALASLIGNILSMVHYKTMLPLPHVVNALLNSTEILIELIKHAESSNEANIADILKKLEGISSIAKIPRVLIADDQTFFRQMLRKLLVSMKYEVVGEASNGDEVVELFKREKPDLLILDIHMPGKNGDVVLEEITELAPFARVVMLTSIGDSDIVTKCLKLGAVNYILKGATREHMKAKIERSLRAYLE
ncbi:response regulator [bacterium]|nr:response regulator [bacterium]